MEDLEDDIPVPKKQMKTADSKKKAVKVDKKKDEGTSKSSPKRKTAARRKKEDPKNDRVTSKKNKEDSEFQEAENSDNGSDDNFESPGKANTKRKPGKKAANKGKAAGRDEATITVLEYMKKQNRPYSLLNILDNLHGEIKKAQGQKILDQLSEEGEMQMKEYGKAKIYLINQKNIPVVDPEEMENLKVALEGRKAEHTALTNEIKVLKKREAELNNQLTNEQLDQEIERLELMVLIRLVECEEKIEFYKSPEYVRIPDQVINEAEARKNKFEKECKKRRKYCMEMINQLAEGMEKKPKEIEEMIGIERD